MCTSCSDRNGQQQQTHYCRTNETEPGREQDNHTQDGQSTSATCLSNDTTTVFIYSQGWQNEHLHGHLWAEKKM